MTTPKPRPQNAGGIAQGNLNRKAVLAALPGDFRRVMAETGIGRTTAWRWLNDLHQSGECHIQAWARVDSGGPFRPSYSPGPGEDAICMIKPYSQAQKSRRHMKRAKKSGEWEDRKARQRAIYWADRALANRDPLVAALFGVREVRHA
ncbi:MAG: hypothetical protein WA191_06955 [Telluria sp.]